MKELVERIKKDGRVLGEGVLKVDSFVTHQVDPVLMEQMGLRVVSLARIASLSNGQVEFLEEDA